METSVQARVYQMWQIEIRTSGSNPYHRGEKNLVKNYKGLKFLKVKTKLIFTEYIYVFMGFLRIKLLPFASPTNT